jgi:hypothetical protein
MYSGMGRTALTNGLHLELDNLEPCDAWMRDLRSEP